MSARNIRSTATSTSVTRSIVLFLSIRIARPKRSICIAPARVTASTAVARKIGSGRAMHTLDHPDLHAAFGRSVEVDDIHEVADDENPAPAPLQQVFRRERIFEGIGIEAGTFVAH